MTEPESTKPAEDLRGSWIAKIDSWTSRASAFFSLIWVGSHFAGYDPPFSLLIVAVALGLVGFGITLWSTPSPKRYRVAALAILMGGALISATHAPPGLAYVLFASAFIVMIGFVVYERSVEKAAKAAPGNGADPGA